MKKLLYIIVPLLLLSCLNNTNDDKYIDVSKEIVKQYKNSKRYVIIVDFTKNIFSERLYLVDLKTDKIILRSCVSHGYKSGYLYASKFSNISGSNQSSGGTYMTMYTYNGKWGYSMKIKGLDKGVNNLAFQRKIVIHSTKKMKTPWSLGCFATSENINKKLINLTKNGCLLHVIN
jgi:hypothetical protein